MATVKIRGVDDPVHGTIIVPCPVCEILLSRFNLDSVP